MSSQAPCTEATPDLIIYGGTFDPPHCGHLDMLQSVMRRFPNARVVVVPSYMPPKVGSTGGKQVVASFDDRVGMVQRLLASVDSARVSLLELERDLPAPNYSLKTIQSIASLFPKDRLGFLLGQDQLDSFGQWHEPRAILGLTDLIVAPRALTAQAGHNLQGTIEKVLMQLHLKHQWDAKGQSTFLQDPGKTIYLLTEHMSPATSTHIRKCIAEGTNAPGGWMLPGVDIYIKNRNLYRHTEV